MRVLTVGVLAAWSVLMVASAARVEAGDPKPDVVTVRVTGEGIDRESALKDALRRAIERGGHLEVYANSQAENYTLVRDTVLAQATGLIRDYQILRQGEDVNGVYFVEISARVDRRIIDATWGQVQILLQQMGRPKILVNFVEKIYDCGFNPPVETIEESSLLENRIEQLLTEKGFDLVDRKQIERLKRDRLERATLGQDRAALKALAEELGAQMFITGSARASGPQVSDAYGVRLYLWETDVTLKAFWSETGQILFGRDEQGSRGGSRTPGPPGAKQAIAKAGDQMATACLQAILEKWSKQSVSGGRIILEVRGLDFRRMLMVQDALQQIEGVGEVTRQWHKPVARFEIITVQSAEKFAEILASASLPGFALDVEDQKFNTIRARFEATAESGSAPVPAEAAPPPPEKPPAPTVATTVPASRPATRPSTGPATQPATAPTNQR